MYNNFFCLSQKQKLAAYSWWTVNQQQKEFNPFNCSEIISYHKRHQNTHLKCCSRNKDKVVLFNLLCVHDGCVWVCVTGLLVLIFFYSGKKHRKSWHHGSLSHTICVRQISPSVGDKVIPMNAIWFGGGGPLIWHYEVCCQITQNLRGPCKSSRGVLCKPGTTNLLVCTRGHLVMDTLSRGTGGPQYNSRRLILKGLF